MKKLWILAMTLLLVAFCLFPAFAAEISEGDSAVTDPEVIAKLELQEGETAIRFYEMDFVGRFSKCADVDEVLKKRDGLSIGYMVLNQEVVVRKYLEKDGLFQRDDERHITAAKKEILHEYLHHDALKQVSETIQIEKMYMIESDGIGMLCTGSAIYYETDMGPYVYYQESAGPEYLFTAEEFQDAMAYYAWVVENHIRGGASLSDGERDFSRYDIHSENFYLNQTSFPWVYVLAGGAIVLVGALAVAVLLKRKKAA